MHHQRYLYASALIGERNSSMCIIIYIHFNDNGRSLHIDIYAFCNYIGDNYSKNKACIIVFAPEGSLVNLLSFHTMIKRIWQRKCSPKTVEKHNPPKWTHVQCHSKGVLKIITRWRLKLVMPVPSHGRSLFTFSSSDWCDPVNIDNHDWLIELQLMILNYYWLIK